MIKSDLYASYDAKLTLEENEISFGTKEREIHLYFENEEDMEKARKILKEKNL